MINELEDSVSIAKLDSETGEQVAGAKLVIKDSNGYIVSEFTSTDKMYSLQLKSGVYTLYEVEAPKGYELSNDVVTFKLLDDGTVQVLNGNGKYEDVVYVSFYNKKKPEEIIEEDVHEEGLNDLLDDEPEEDPFETNIPMGDEEHTILETAENKESEEELVEELETYVPRSSNYADDFDEEDTDTGVDIKYDTED